MVETPEYILEDKNQQVVARVRAWVMDGFSVAWNRQAAGLFDLEVSEPLRRQGLAKYLLALLLKHLQEQFFDVAEMHVDETNAAGAALCRGLGFELVDTGRVHKKQESVGGP